MPNMKILSQNHTFLEFCNFRWLKTVFDTCASFTFFSKTLNPSVAGAAQDSVSKANAATNIF